MSPSARKRKLRFPVEGPTQDERELERTHVQVITPGVAAGELVHVLSPLEQRSARWDTDPDSAGNRCAPRSPSFYAYWAGTPIRGATSVRFAKEAMIKHPANKFLYCFFGIGSKDMSASATFTAGLAWAWRSQATARQLLSDMRRRGGG